MQSHIQNKIEEDIKNNPIILYMKGSPSFPLCGFSKAVIDVLNSYSVEYKTINVLEDNEIRQGIKEYSDWPTIPQLYVRGNFVGGCDIVLEHHEKGELKSLLCP